MKKLLKHCNSGNDVALAAGLDIERKFTPDKWYELLTCGYKRRFESLYVANKIKYNKIIQVLGVFVEKQGAQGVKNYIDFLFDVEQVDSVTGTVEKIKSGMAKTKLVTDKLIETAANTPEREIIIASLYNTIKIVAPNFHAAIQAFQAQRVEVLSASTYKKAKEKIGWLVEHYNLDPVTDLATENLSDSPQEWVSLVKKHLTVLTHKDSNDASKKDSAETLRRLAQGLEQQGEPLLTKCVSALKTLSKNAKKKEIFLAAFYCQIKPSKDKTNRSPLLAEQLRLSRMRVLIKLCADKLPTASTLDAIKFIGKNYSIDATTWGEALRPFINKPSIKHARKPVFEYLIRYFGKLIETQFIAELSPEKWLIVERTPNVQFITELSSAANNEVVKNIFKQYMASFNQQEKAFFVNMPFILLNKYIAAGLQLTDISAENKKDTLAEMLSQCNTPQPEASANVFGSSSSSSSNTEAPAALISKLIVESKMLDPGDQAELLAAHTAKYNKQITSAFTKTQTTKDRRGKRPFDDFLKNWENWLVSTTDESISYEIEGVKTLLANWHNDVICRSEKSAITTLSKQQPSTKVPLSINIGSNAQPPLIATNTRKSSIKLSSNSQGFLSSGDAAPKKGVWFGELPSIDTANQSSSSSDRSRP